ncbi:MAG: M23 family metallopeptidase [Bacteroidia bacterium]|nr:M23 family metallopeptidase [Bacteroidia bacterium]MDW8158256.1 M23 family metallopeptidase [Bacteroidia bacterium]
MGKKVRYTFDPVSIQYVEVKSSWRKICGRYLAKLVVAAFFSYATYPLWIQLEEINIQHETKAAYRHIALQYKELTQLEKKLNKVHNNDQNFYRSILNQKRIEKSIWEGGTGGTVNNTMPSIPLLAKVKGLIQKLDHKFKVQQESFAAIQKIAQEKSQELKHIPAIIPVFGRIVSGFGYRNDPFFGYGHFHAGIDIVAQVGTPVKASADGIIKTAGIPEVGYGLQIEVDHGYGYVTKYAHLSALNVRVGQKVKRGDIIGYTGNSGYSTGPHLHYEVIKNGIKVNPYDYFYSEY